MSKKQLQVSGIVNELSGASGFFTSGSPAAPAPIAAVPSPPVPDPPRVSIPEPLPGKSQISHPQDVTTPPNERSNERTVEPSPYTPVKRSDIRTVERTEDRPSRRYPVREKIRHSFDVYADQLISLRELAIEQEKLFGERVLIGDLVQQAIDMLITKERNQ